MWQDTAEGNGCADQCVEFLVTSDSELQMSRSDTLDLEILGGITSEFENFGSEVFEDGSDVDSSWQKLEQRLWDEVWATTDLLRQLSSCSECCS